MKACVALVALAACGDQAGSPPRAAPASGAAPRATPAPANAADPASGRAPGQGLAPAATPGPRAVPDPACERVPFAETAPLAEASGAAWLELDGALGLVVVGDSGRRGAFVVLDPDSGDVRAGGTLPLGAGAGDDLEGLAARGRTLYGLTSAGQLRAWTWRQGRFHLDDGPYPIGDGDDVCEDPRATNCARDYEGLAIAPGPVEAGACAGYACSRADGALYCLVERDRRFRVDHARSIRVARPGTLADCAFSDDGELFTGNNLFGMSMVHRIDGWRAPAAARPVELAALGLGFPEVVAARGPLVYRMSDTGGDGPSLMTKFRCPRATR